MIEWYLGIKNYKNVNYRLDFLLIYKDLFVCFNMRKYKNLEIF